MVTIDMTVVSFHRKLALALYRSTARSNPPATVIYYIFPANATRPGRGMPMAGDRKFSARLDADGPRAGRQAKINACRFPSRRRPDAGHFEARYLD